MGVTVLVLFMKKSPLKKTPLKRVGKKTRDWLSARQQLHKRFVELGEMTEDEMGVCMDCGEWKKLTMDHRLKRSNGGPNTIDNIDLVCLQCHFNRDQNGDPLRKKT